MSSKCLKTETAELLAPVNNIILLGRGVFLHKGTFGQTILYIDSCPCFYQNLNKVPVKKKKKNASESEAMPIDRGEAPALSFSRTHPSPRFIWAPLLYTIRYILYCTLKQVHLAAAT